MVLKTKCELNESSSLEPSRKYHDTSGADTDTITSQDHEDI